MRTAYCGGGGAGGGFGSGGGGGGYSGYGTTMGAGGNFYSPELSTDFLELPQSIDERRNYYRFFYANEPFVSQAVDMHAELPLSKLRLARPRARDRELARKALRFCEKWCRRHNLMQFLIGVVREWNLLGEVFIWLEDDNPEAPRETFQENIGEVNEFGELVDTWVDLDEQERDTRYVKWLNKNYRGWTSIQVLPPDNIHMEYIPLANKRIIEFVPGSREKNIIQLAQQGDRKAKKIVQEMPGQVVKAIKRGENIPLDTDPEAQSFCVYFARKMSPYEERGRSILQPILRTLVYRDKLRQAQTSIASRHMTPIRLVSADGMNEDDVEALREQIDMALMDPDFTVISNFKIEWEEMSGRDRLLDLSSEYDLTDRQMYSGLGVTEGLLSGEGAFSGERITLEVINTRYLLLREQLQHLVEENIFKPMCARMGFVEIDEDGDEVVIYPRLSFSRLALRDNQDTFDALFNMYQKGSLDTDSIYDVLNIDGDAVRERLREDLFTLNDSTFNEVLRGLYSRIGDELVDRTDAIEIIARNLGLAFSADDAGDERF